MPLTEITFWEVKCDGPHCSMKLEETFENEAEALACAEWRHWKWIENKILCVDCWMETPRTPKAGVGHLEERSAGTHEAKTS